MDNILLLSDSYKVSHWRQYPPGTEYVYSYFESRGCDREGWHDCCFFGLQYFLKKYLCGQVVTKEKIDEAEFLYAGHFGDPSLFYRAGWEYILEHHNGHLPIKIKAVPEGMVLPLKTVLMTVVNTDPNCFWLVNFLETLLVQVWYPTCVATNSRKQKEIIQHYLEQTGSTDFAPPNGVAFKLHDFGFRGVSSVESAATGGLGHLVNFMGTDTVAALVGACRYYNAEEAMGFSIPASEHSTITSWGVDGEVEAMRNMLEQYPTGLVACVSDSFDIFKACQDYWGGELKDLIKGRISGDNFGRLVVRPDSGDPTETCVAVISILCQQFAEEVTITATGHKLLPPYIRVIQGDGVDYQTIPTILQALADQGFAADNLGFGSGGALLQKVNRDTLKIAFKCSEITIAGQTREVFKDPITDNGKASKKGRLTLQLASDFANCSEEDLYRPRDGPDGVKGGTGFLHFTPDGQFVTVASGMGDESRDIMLEVFENGNLLVDYSLPEIRQRADIVNGPFVQPMEVPQPGELDVPPELPVEEQPASPAKEQVLLPESPASAKPASPLSQQPQVVAMPPQQVTTAVVQQPVQAAPGVIYSSPPAQATGITPISAMTQTTMTAAAPALAPTTVVASAPAPALTICGNGGVARYTVTPMSPTAATTAIGPQTISRAAPAPVVMGQGQAPAVPATGTIAGAVAAAATAGSPITTYKVSAAAPPGAPQVSTPVPAGTTQVASGVSTGHSQVIPAGPVAGQPMMMGAPQVVGGVTQAPAQFIRVQAQGPSFVAAPPPPGAMVNSGAQGPSFVAAPPPPPGAVIRQVQSPSFVAAPPPPQPPQYTTATAPPAPVMQQPGTVPMMQPRVVIVQQPRTSQIIGQPPVFYGGPSPTNRGGAPVMMPASS